MKLTATRVRPCHHRWSVNLSVILFALCIGVLVHPGPQVAQADQLEERCRECRILGGIGAFAEIVKVEVKELGLSSTLDYEEADHLHEPALAIARDFGVELYRERDLLITDLFPHDVAANKEVFLIFSGNTLNKYLALKDRHRKLSESGLLDLDNRATIAVEFGRLLSYPDHIIERMLEASIERREALSLQDDS